MDVRRVVTGHDANGKAVFVSDEQVEPVTLALLPGQRVPPALGSDDDRRRSPTTARDPSAPRYFPPVGGFRFGFFTIPPDGGAGVPGRPRHRRRAGRVRREAAGHGRTPRARRSRHAHHRHASTTASCFRARPPSSSTTAPRSHSNPGDTYIQNGTRHRWSNTGDVPAVLAVAIVGAHHSNVGTGAR